MQRLKWTLQKIEKKLKIIEPLQYPRIQPLSAFSYAEVSEKFIHPPFEISDSVILGANSYWGGWLKSFILKTTFQIPLDWALKEGVILHFMLGDAGDFIHPEGLVYIDEKPIGSCDRYHQELKVPNYALNHDVHNITIHGWTGIGGLLRGEPYTKLFMGQSTIRQVNTTARIFIHKVGKLLDVIRSDKISDTAKSKLIQILDDAFAILDTREPHSSYFFETLTPALEKLENGISTAMAPLDIRIFAVGHAHIDIAWLWTKHQARKKAARTFHTVIQLMDNYPEFIFAQSQPQLYEYIQQDFPELFERIKQKVAEGQWEPLGGMWVEADTNLPGAEALVRQFVLGQTYFRDTFGKDVDSKILWLPDVFGYPASLPQIANLAGIKYFYSVKLGWNQYNKFPYNTFWWQGIDGSRILSYFGSTPESGTHSYRPTYNADVNPSSILETWENISHKDVQSSLLMSYGFGDGGGGPTEEMIENIRMFRQFPELPQMSFNSAKTFFETLENDSSSNFPTWHGELYLELHRGTYTTQSEIKRINRQTEILLHDMEFLLCLAQVLDPEFEVKKEEIAILWRLLCLQHFHDILPGSSIREVYLDSMNDYNEITKQAHSKLENALSRIVEHFSGDLLLINPTSFQRDDVAFWQGKLLDGKTLIAKTGRVILQATEDGTLIALEQLRPFSAICLTMVDSVDTVSDISTQLTVSTTHLENEYVYIELNNHGDIIKYFDKKHGRDIVPKDSILGQFQVFEDRPMSWDAWDIDIYYDDKVWFSNSVISIKVKETGPIRASIRITRTILESSYTQELSLYYNSPILTISTQIDWHERHTLLKAAFPLDLVFFEAAYEIQWGHIKRATHRNTSWDWGKFEVCGHKWVNVSETGYGVSLINDCKYGFDIQDNILRISLLRSPTRPDPLADQGYHEFSYAIYPHPGMLNEVIKHAYCFNDKIIVHESKVKRNTKQKSLSDLGFISTDVENVVIETVKLSEEDSAIVIRLYEALGARTRFSLQSDLTFYEAWQVDLLERNLTPLDIDGQSIKLEIQPFQIITIRIIFIR